MVPILYSSSKMISSPILAKLLSSESSSDSGAAADAGGSFGVGWDEFIDMNVSLFFLRACCFAKASRPLMATLNAGGRFGSNVASSIFFLSFCCASKPLVLLRVAMECWLLLLPRIDSLNFQAGIAGFDDVFSDMVMMLLVLERYYYGWQHRQRSDQSSRRVWGRLGWRKGPENNSAIVLPFVQFD